MYFIRKLRPPEMSIETIIGLGLAPILLLLFVLIGVNAMFGFIAIVELIAMIIQLNLFIRSRNIAFLWMALSFFIITVFAIDIAFFGLDKNKAEFPILAVGVIFATIIIIYILTSKKVKWRTREMLELSAMPVTDVKNGFTERPHPSGKIEATKLEVEAFTKFIRKNLIAIPYEEDENVVYSFTSNYWKQIGLKSGYEDESWVSIDKKGNVNSFISKNDYLKFKDDFSFDQLCNSMGSLFIEFFELFKRGEGVRIINRFNDLRLNPFIE